uniref:AlNc14C73G4966 protein n=1 Tax=Albugo laibachii Nc14 TaxID=890382 RepID=F0WEA9_9STRA|nr:AlNc14C73G4966 [Albugo laibachii Nc14]|eukprot:CCA19540.1 AlNc14C73G4966 [Albugo laibachii Nc14]
MHYATIEVLHKCLLESIATYLDKQGRYQQLPYEFLGSAELSTAKCQIHVSGFLDAHPNEAPTVFIGSNLYAFCKV